MGLCVCACVCACACARARVCSFSRRNLLRGVNNNNNNNDNNNENVMWLHTTITCEKDK